MADRPEPTLAQLRERIDATDAELLALLNRRAGLALEVGEIKKREGSVVFRPEREAQVIDTLKRHNPGPLKTESIAPVWREIMSACRALETPTRVAYLGPAGTYSEEAALGFFGSSIVRVACGSFDEVFNATAGGSADFGVVAVENSTEGGVARTLDLFLHTPLTIIGETSLFVRHNLLRRQDHPQAVASPPPPPDGPASTQERPQAVATPPPPPEGGESTWGGPASTQDGLEGIQTVLAHPQALAQCHEWLNTHLPKAERRPVASNAEGARLAAADPRVAAIASARAGSEYGLHLVAPAIQDDPHNRTRFAIVTDPQRHPPPAASGHDCTSLVLSVPNRPGAVHDLLVPLKTHGVSMTRFESRPARSGQWEYYFYIDIDGHPQQPAVAAALAALREVCAFFKVLGAYPVDLH